ncbi:hypothetical protein KSP39_PZI005352 [Platanthera zijinensis]|uniref:Uncharacterized protein n=1 Tax=Platanthera zijinensis TaxID=2320716 RepID=A0AAP0BSA2_9ASPA
MGGKGRRRREKNYLAAHGGNSRLPPPPNLKEHDALPSKLRRIMQLNNSSSLKHEAIERSTETGHGKKNDESSSKNNTNLKESRLGNVIAKLGGGVDKTKNNIVKEKSTSAESSSADAKKRKRKRNSAKDLRFENLDQFGKHSKRKERKKQYLKEKKNKHKKVNEDDGLDFPGREQIRFGEVVTAPPKLSFRKVPKTPTKASSERLRLQVIEGYRKVSGFDSRPGVKLPLPSFVETAALLTG